LLNSAQGGDDVSITLAAADVTGTNALYAGQRIFITQGLGIGQYGYISSYDDLTKVALISKDVDDTPGWESIYPGRPIVTSLDSSTRYSLEPRVIVDEPQWNVSVSSSPYAVAGIAYQNGTYVIVASTTWSAFSTDGITWTNVPRSGVAVSGVYASGNNTFVALADTGSEVYVYESPGGWRLETVNTTPDQWVAATYDAANSCVHIIGTAGRTSISFDHGASWADGGLLPSTGHIDVAANRAVVVALKPGNTFALSSDVATTWTSVTAPISRTWSSITYGNGRFVIVGDTADTLYSFDGTTWYQGTMPVDKAWSNVQYAGGLFVAINSEDNVIATSQCGQHWKTTTQANVDKEFNVAHPYVHLAAGEVNGTPTWIAADSDGLDLGIVRSGATAIVRAVVTSSRIQKFLIYEPGSGYSGIPVLTITDNGKTEDVTYTVRTGNGVLPQPVFYNRGLGFVRAIASVTGNGYGDIYQNSSTLYVSNLSRLPGPGDNLEIAGITDVVYKISSIDTVTGSTPALSGRITITPTIDRSKAPGHNIDVTIRQYYSQVRLTGHDFLDVGSGNVGQTQYPDIYLAGFTPINEPQPFNEVVESGGGRVFYTSTDQDGNFRVGELFKVEQSTGIVSVNASYFDLNGLTELSLGGIQVGGTAVVIRDFSKDQNFSANSNNVVPTQRAIIAYLESRISSGGADAVTNVLIAGQVRISSNNITTTSGLPIQAIPKFNIIGGTDGHYLASMYYAFGSMVG